LSEDYLFCKIYSELGGDLNHTGIIDYIGCLSINIGEIDILNKDTQMQLGLMKNKNLYCNYLGVVKDGKKTADFSTFFKKKLIIYI
jgi:hypothetical protein